jgi:transcriptional regulator with XRE-family HTH domain
MTAATILGRSPSKVLVDVGTALLQIKNARGLTLDDMGYHLGVSREMVAQYIAGEAEMGFLKWLRANQKFPELSDRIEETAAERALRASQRALDLDPASAPGQGRMIARLRKLGVSLRLGAHQLLGVSWSGFASLRDASSIAWPWRCSRRRL